MYNTAYSQFRINYNMKKKNQQQCSPFVNNFHAVFRISAYQNAVFLFLAYPEY